LGHALAQAIPPVSVRLRRDFGALLNLIHAHFVLHQATWAKTAEGALIATLDDFAAVRELIADLVADGAESSVAAHIRETVEVAGELRQSGTDDGHSMDPQRLGHDFRALPLLHTAHRAGSQLRQGVMIKSSRIVCVHI